MTILGFILLLLGGSAMDSNSQVIPILMVLAGITILFIKERRMQWSE